MGIKLHEDVTLYTLHFVDDQVVIAQNKEALDFTTRGLFKYCEEWGLSVNKSKTQYLQNGKNKMEAPEIDQQQTIYACNEYTYLRTKMEEEE